MKVNKSILMFAVLSILSINIFSCITCKHDYEIVETVPATCEKIGYETLQCKNCNKKFYAITNEIGYRCHISKQVKLAVLNCAKEMMSKSLIARLYNISDNTVQSIFDTIYYNDTVYKDFYLVMDFILNN